MFFTREDILKIQNALLQLSVKDSELPSAEPVTYDDTLSIVQDGKNKQIKIEDFFNQISLWKREDFINITDKYDEHYISLIEAINLVPVLQRKDGLVITFQDVEDNWEIYQFRGNITEFFNIEKWFNLYDYRNNIIQSIVPDEEDLTASIPDENGNSLVSLKDRVYDPTSFSGKGYKILRKNIQSVNIAVTKIKVEFTPSSDGILSFSINGKETRVSVSVSVDNTTTLVADKIATKLTETMTEYEVSKDASTITLTRKFVGSVTPSIFSASTTGVVCTITDSTKKEFRNILTSTMINQANTIYVIKYDFTLGEDITIPENCVLEFDGGSIRNGKININNCKKINNLKVYNVEIYGFNTALTGNNIDILDVCSSYITYSNGNIYGLANAINTFLNNLKSPDTLSGITIKIPSGKFIIEETIYIPIGVSLIGCSGTEFVLDFTNNKNNDTVGIMIDYHYMNPPSFDNPNQHYYYSTYRDCVKNLCIKTEVDNNNYEGIHDNHGTHNIECIRFINLYRYLMCTENYTGRLRYYGDHRTIKDLYCSNNTKNTFKIYISNGDAQSLDKVLGYVGIVIIGAHITISNCISTELVLINVNAVINGLHCEQEPCMVYNSNITFNNCLFGNILQNNAVELNRTKYFNNLEIDTNRIIQRVLDDNLVIGYEGGVNPNPGDMLHYSSSSSNITINNSKFIGLGYTFDTVPKSDINNEYYYIYAENQYKIIINNSYCQFDYNASPNGPRFYPRMTSRIGPPEGIAYGQSINNINTIPTLSVTKETSTFGSGMAAGTYYYRIGIAQDIYRGIGSKSDNEVSITISDGECIRLQLTNMSSEDLSNQSIIIWRGTAPNTYTKMCILQIQKDARFYTSTKNISQCAALLQLGYDSLTHLCGFKWINNVRNTLDKCSKITKIEGNNYIIDFGNDIRNFYSIFENGDIIIDDNKKFIYDSSLDNGTLLSNNLRYIGNILKKNLPSLKNWNMYKGIPFYDETTTPHRMIYWNGTHWLTSDGIVAKWNVKTGMSHIANFSNTAPANTGEQYSTIITAETGYTLSGVGVLINNKQLTINTDYTFNLSTGELVIFGIGGTGGITGDLIINAWAI